MKRTTFKRKSTAKKHRGAGRRVYKIEGGYRVSPECPRGKAKRRALVRQRPKTRKAKRKSDMAVISVVWKDDIAPF